MTEQLQIGSDEPVQADVARWRAEFALADGVAMLNPGGFGTVPRRVTTAIRRLQDRIESDPVDFHVRRYAPEMAAAMEPVQRFLGAPAGSTAFVGNATMAMNVVAAAIPLRLGDEVLATAVEYGSVADLWRRRCTIAGARWTEVADDGDLDGDLLLERLAAAKGPRTRLVVVSQLTSSTASVLPVAGIAAWCRSEGLLCVVDGAHAPGHLPVDVAAIGADAWLGNLHKWALSGRPAAVLHVGERLAHVAPVVRSWFSDDPDLLTRFSIPGTIDPSTWLTARVGLELWDELDAEGAWAHGADLLDGLAVRLRELWDEDREINRGAALAPRMRAWWLPDATDALQLRKVCADEQVAVWADQVLGRPVLRVGTSAHTRPRDVDRLVALLPTD